METRAEQSGDNLDSEKSIWKKDVSRGVEWAAWMAILAAGSFVFFEEARAIVEGRKAKQESQALNAKMEQLLGPLVTTRQKLLEASRMENTSLEKVPGATAAEK